MKKLNITIISMLLSIFLVSILIITSDKDFEYDYNNELYTNEQILDDYTIYENTYIKFLYPNDLQIINNKDNRVFLLSTDNSKYYSTISVTKDSNKPYISNYSNLPEGLVNFLMINFHSAKTPAEKDTTIYKEKYNDKNIFVIETVSKEDNIAAIQYIFENSGNYVYFEFVYLYDNQFDDNFSDLKNIVLSSVLIK